MTIDFAERTVKGFSKEAIPPLVPLAKSLHNNREDFVRGVGSNVMCGVVAKVVVEIFRGRSGDQANAVDLAELKRQIGAWFAEAAVTRRHLVPCRSHQTDRPKALAPCPRSRAPARRSARRGPKGGQAGQSRPHGQVAVNRRDFEIRQGVHRPAGEQVEQKQ